MYDVEEVDEIVEKSTIAVMDGRRRRKAAMGLFVGEVRRVCGRVLAALGCFWMSHIVYSIGE